MLPSLVLLTAAVFFASVVQSVAGFAYGLILMPLLLTAGYSLPETTTISMLTSLVNWAVMLRQLHGAVEWKPLRPMMATGLLALPVGILLMHRVSGMAAPTIKHVVGVIVALLVILQWSWRIAPRAHVHAAWGHVAAVSAGLLQGFGAIGGPPLVLWILAHEWPSDRLRITLNAYSSIYIIPQLALLYLVCGNVIPQAALLSLIVLPAAVAGSVLGLLIGAKLERPKVVLLVRVLLVLVAVSLMI